MPQEFNSVNEEIKNEAKKVWKSKTGKERVKYFVYYYKVHFIVGVIVICLLASVIHFFATRKECIFQVLVVNGQSVDLLDYKEFIDGYAKTLTYDEKKQELIIDPNYLIDVYAADQYNQTNIQKVFMNVAVGELDVMLCDEDFMKFARAQDCAYDLTTILPKEDLEKYEDKLVWYDFPFEEVGIEGYEEEYKQDYEGRYEALCIDITDFEKIKEYDMFPGKNGYAIIISNTSHLDNAIGFLEYLDTP